jgi:hypothetical protein
MAKKATRLALCFCAVALSPVTASLPGDGGAPGRPNLLFILTDDQRADMVGAHGNPHVKTPSLDRLARRGFAFREAHIMGANQGAVCAPSRTARATAGPRCRCRRTSCPCTRSTTAG